MGIISLVNRISKVFSTNIVDNYMEVCKRYRVEFVNNLSEGDYNSAKSYLVANSENVVELHEDYAVIDTTQYNLTVLLNDKLMPRVISSITQIAEDIKRDPMLQKVQVKLIFKSDKSCIWDHAWSNTVTKYLCGHGFNYCKQYLTGGVFSIVLVCTKEELLEIFSKFLGCVSLEYIEDVE